MRADECFLGVTDFIMVLRMLVGHVLTRQTLLVPHIRAGFPQEHAVKIISQDKNSAAGENPICSISRLLPQLPVRPPL